MKRNRIRRFFQQKQYAIASLVLFAAIAGMTGIYVSNRITNESREEELAQKEAELSEAAEREREELAALDDQALKPLTDVEQKGDSEEAASVSSIIKPGTETDEKKSGQESGTQNDTAAKEENQGAAGQENTGQADSENQKRQTQKAEEKQEKKDTATHAKAAVLHFSPENDLGWPLQGDVILNYSMDQTIYFATLEQYKYNPALIIAGKVNDPVNAAATGKITDISTNEETGVIVTMDLGDGYSAIYGQLKEVLYKEGAVVEAGNAIGYIAEPTKYYSVEGSNLYFELQKDGEPVNPIQYMQ